MANLHQVEIDERNIDNFIRAYNQARMHKAARFPFEGNEIPVPVAFAMLMVIKREQVIYGEFDNAGMFKKQFNPQLN